MIGCRMIGRAKGCREAARNAPGATKAALSLRAVILSLTSTHKRRAATAPSSLDAPDAPRISVCRFSETCSTRRQGRLGGWCLGAVARLGQFHDRYQQASAGKKTSKHRARTSIEVSQIGPCSLLPQSSSTSTHPTAQMSSFPSYAHP